MAVKPKVICVIMGGGRGSRLHPLTRDRCKPAVPLGGKYRLVDIPISNCLNSGLNRIYLLTQFNTASLHRHLRESYTFDPYGGGFVDILSAEQTEAGDSWYQGTSDAVRQNRHHFSAEEHDLFLVLSGDQLYRMDFREIIRQHRQTGAGLTIAAKPMPVSDVAGLGLMRVDDDLAIAEFAEKPTDPEIIRSLTLSERVTARMQSPPDTECCLASMGIYVFNKSVLYDALESSTAVDFGREVIPGLLGRVGMYSYIFDGYWEDIGTVRSFFEANIRLTELDPPFNFFDAEHVIYTHARFLPGSKVIRSDIDCAVLADGCVITDARIKRSVVGIRSVIRGGSRLENVVMMGQDFFETPEDLEQNLAYNRPHVGIGRNCRVDDAIIDKNARIGDAVKLSPDGKPDGFDWGHGEVVVRDGVLVVARGAIIPDGTEI